jgi:hypothetical protein
MEPAGDASSVSRRAGEESRSRLVKDPIAAASSMIHAVTGIQRRERKPERRHILFSRAG